MKTNSKNVNLNNKRRFVSSVLFLIFFLLHFGVANAAPGDISTVAGNGIPGYSGDGGAATSASLGPWCVAVDGVGNIYIADGDNNVIRMVTASTGIITTVAGNGIPDYSGDGGAATSASLDFPSGVAVDGAGNIYIADGDNNVIRMVTASTGIITTVAGNGTQDYSGDGGAATSASLDFPTGVAVDGAGNIYIADGDNNVIRMVTASTGIITTVAGNGTQDYSGDGGAATLASLDGPEGVVVDGAGNIYIADGDNNVIRMVTASTGIITTVAGDGIPGYSGDGGAATSASLDFPAGVAVDGAGNIYIADHDNSRIRKVTASPINNCAATLSADYKVYVPIGVYNGQSYSAAFQWDGANSVTLTNLTLLNDTSAFNNCTPSSVSSAMILHIPVIIYSGVSYWADVQCNTAGLPFAIIGVGRN